MSDKKWVNFIGIGLLILWWLYYAIGTVFFIEELHSDSLRPLFRLGYDYPVTRILGPFVMGVALLYFWAKADIKNTGIAWLSFALLVLIMLIYTLATPKPVVVCEPNRKNCYIQKTTDDKPIVMPIATTK